MIVLSPGITQLLTESFQIPDPVRPGVKVLVVDRRQAPVLLPDPLELFNTVGVIDTLGSQLRVPVPI